MEEFSTEMVCYACRNRLARPRNIGGTLYFLCDKCFNQHVWANFKALEYMKTKSPDFGDNMKGRSKDSDMAGEL